MLKRTVNRSRRIPSVRALRSRQHLIGTRAFTVVELIGVLAIISVLAAAIMPNVIRRIDRATLQRETSDLAAMGNGLVRYVETAKIIPATNVIAQAIATYSDLALSQITNTPRKFRRLVLVDPNLNVNGFGPAAGYNQGVSGSSLPPVNARVMILSTIATPALSVNLSDFNTIWNTNPALGSVVGITGGQKADDLCIQRVELGGLFHKLVVRNLDTNASSLAYFSFEANAPAAPVASGQQQITYLFDGTSVNLLTNNAVTSVQFRDLITQDESFVFKDGRWNRDLGIGTANTTSLGPFGKLVDQFVKSNYRTNNNALNGSRPQAVAEAFYAFMVDYIIWSQGDVAYGINPWQGTAVSASSQFPYYKLIYDQQNSFDNNNLTSNLIQ